MTAPSLVDHNGIAAIVYNPEIIVVKSGTANILSGIDLLFGQSRKKCGIERCKWKRPIIDLGQLVRSSPQEVMRAWEEAQFNRLTADIFGFHALQIGLPQIHALAARVACHQWQTDSVMPAPNVLSKNQVVLVHDFRELPLKHTKYRLW